MLHIVQVNRVAYGILVKHAVLDNTDLVAQRKCVNHAGPYTAAGTLPDDEQIRNV